jgi:hypothetical protein
MRMHRCKSWPGFLTLGFFLILLSGLAIGADLGGLPQNWNPRNLAEIESPPSNTLTFAVLGDTKDGYKTLGRLFRQMNREGDLAFAMYLGDMVARGTVANYRIFFREIWRNLRIPLLGVIGNHELNGNGGGLYREIWGPPYYSFQVKGNYFIVLDDAESEDLNPSQMHWLERELQKAQGSQTRLVFMHVPLFDPRGGRHHHCLPPAVATPLLELFNKYRVTYIFAAHIHGYFTGSWAGIPFTITGGAGAPLYGADLKHFFYHYLKVSVTGEKLRIQVRPLRAAPQPGAALSQPQGWAAGVP